MTARKIFKWAVAWAVVVLLFVAVWLEWIATDFWTHVRMIGLFLLFAGLSVCGRKVSREIVGKAMFVVGLLLASLALAVQFLLPAVVHEVQRQTASAAQAASDEFWSHLPSWARR